MSDRKKHALRTGWFNPGFGVPGWNYYYCQCGVAYLHPQDGSDPPRALARDLHREHLTQVAPEGTQETALD